MPYTIFRSDAALQLSEDQPLHYPDIFAALDAIENEQAESVLLCDSGLAAQGMPELPPDRHRYDLLHAGLCLGAKNVFHSLWLISTNWFFLDPDANRYGVSWKATPALCWLRPKMVRNLGGFDRTYQSGFARLMDMAYRSLAAGGRVCHFPFHGENINSAEINPDIPLFDEILFIIRHVGLSGALYAAFWLCLITKKPLKVLRDLIHARRQSYLIPAPNMTTASPVPMQLANQTRHQQVGRISAVIPTINRYDYLPNAIHSLLKQNPAPDEIIVIDQTPVANRQPEIYRQFEGSPVHVTYLDKAGQSNARNVGICTSKHEWCFLFDDDSVAWDGLLAHHIQALEYTGAFISTGASLAPWKTIEHIPTRNRFLRLSDVLDTGNCLAKKQVLLNVGGLDLAFDRGSGTDHDLGVRLNLGNNEIIFNPFAIRTHFKAPSGGLRTYGAWWRNHAPTWGPYPQATQVYTIQRYYPRQFWLPLYLLYYIKAREQMSLAQYIWLWLTLPWKLGSAIRAARKLRTTFIQPNE
jgi:glycosyltransferase involved in cell wall biosynthesis